jgi:hypothetical protein
MCCRYCVCKEGQQLSKSRIFCGKSKWWGVGVAKLQGYICARTKWQPVGASVSARDAIPNTGKINARSLDELLNFFLEFTILATLTCRIFIQDAHLQANLEACYTKEGSQRAKFKRESTVFSHWARSLPITFMPSVHFLFLSYTFFNKS